jgi:hypothetical protein
MATQSLPIPAQGSFVEFLGHSGAWSVTGVLRVTIVSLRVLLPANSVFPPSYFGLTDDL